MRFDAPVGICGSPGGKSPGRPGPWTAWAVDASSSTSKMPIPSGLPRSSWQSGPALLGRIVAGNGDVVVGGRERSPILEFGGLVSRLPLPPACGDVVVVGRLHGGSLWGKRRAAKSRCPTRRRCRSRTSRRLPKSRSWPLLLRPTIGSRESPSLAPPPQIAGSGHGHGNTSRIPPIGRPLPGSFDPDAGGTASTRRSRRGRTMTPVAILSGTAVAACLSPGPGVRGSIIAIAAELTDRADSILRTAFSA